jgi:YYY domain-containing protein
MIDAVRWLIGMEILGLAFLPVTGAVLGRMRDGGYAFAKAVAILMVTYVTWLVGSFLPVARSPVLPALVALFGLAGWWLWRTETLGRVRDLWRVVAIEEALFLVAFGVWALLRVHVFGTAADHTEQFMDMALLNASYHSASFPAYDPWMSGHSINYYYFGYLMWATFSKLVGVVPTVAFNLANVSIFALVVSCAYSIGYSLTGSRLWSLSAPLFLALLGNLHAALWGIWHGPCGDTSTSTFWGLFWQSTRVIGSNYTLQNWSCAVKPGANPPAIDEYPLFSLILGDLHPHLMALPLVLLTLALAVAYLFGTGGRLVTASAGGLGRLAFLAVTVGSLFVTNSWDFPTYLLVLAGAILMRAYVEDARPVWWRDGLAAVVLLGIASVVLYLPFYIHFRSLSAGIGLVTDTSDPFEFLQMFGLFLAGIGLLVGSLYALLQPEPDQAETFDVVSEAGEARTGAADRLLTLGAIAAVLIAASIAHRLTLMCLLGLGTGALLVAYRVLNTEEPNRADATAILLVAAGCFAAAVPEVLYLKDVFAGGAGYRMNTIFKFYYQAWVLLGLAAAYGAYRSRVILRAIAGRSWSWGAVALVAVLALGAAIYTSWIPSARVDAAPTAGLSASRWLASADPGDASVLSWLNAHARPQQVVLEAVGDDYQTNGTIISTFTGLPTVMGWGGHEAQWRPDDSEVQQRIDAVKTIYTTGKASLARQLLHRYGVMYVLVGNAETAKYGATSAGLRKFARFMRVAYASAGATLYTW